MKKIFETKMINNREYMSVTKTYDKQFDISDQGNTELNQQEINPTNDTAEWLM